jgi:hypothetical protein
MSDASYQLTGRSAHMLARNLDSSSAEIAPELRALTQGQAARLTQYEQWLTETQGENAIAQPSERPQSHEVWLIALASLMLLILAEPLLRFRTIMAVKPSRSLQVPELPGGKGPRRFMALAPLIASARFGLRHLGVVALHIWVMRCVVVALMLALVELPLAAATHIIMPNLIALMGKSQILPLLHFTQLSAAALVSAIALALGTVYDARLYVALDEACGKPS